MGLIDILHSISKTLPSVRVPTSPPNTKERLTWTAIAVILFFIMYHITALGVKDSSSGSLDFLQTITASRLGSLLTVGIGPIVLASIFLQLFVGAKLINLDMKSKEGREKFHEAQKVLGIVLAFAEAAIFVITARVLLIPLFPGLGEGILADGSVNAPYTMALVIIQVALGSIILQYLDEVVSKYGLGSGISLFIAAGVSMSIIGGLVGLIFEPNGVIDTLTGGGAESIPGALIVLLPFIFTIIVFFAVVYAEGIKVEIPIAFERVRGMAPKLPLKLFYVSNIPVIFASALLLNVQLFSASLLPKATDLEAIKSNPLSYLGVVDSSNRLIDGFFYYITPPPFFTRDTAQHFNFLLSTNSPVFQIPEWFHALSYIIFLSLASILFGLFWVETSNMDAKSVASQLGDSGIQIPGFRRDPRMLETILNKHILPLTILGSFSVGILAGLADLTGALGTGTGILLTVGIFYRLYEQMEQMKIFDLYPSMGSMFKD
ncbi:preprotein translocase subunit SecY [Candidatus Micrarchaeota archaeon]|nr:preprotein translocase subunit SecY [Candidatus Micrarchaeota archaeon]